RARAWQLTSCSPGSDSASSSNAGADDEEKLQFLMSDPEASPDLDELGSPLPPLPFASSASASASQPASVSTSFASSSSGGISGRRAIRPQSGYSAAAAAAVCHRLAGSHGQARAVPTAQAAFDFGRRRSRFYAVAASQIRLVRVEKLQHQQQQQQPVAEAAAPAHHLSFGSPQLAEYESVGTSGSIAAYSLVNRQLSSPSSSGLSIFLPTASTKPILAAAASQPTSFISNGPARSPLCCAAQPALSRRLRCHGDGRDAILGRRLARPALMPARSPITARTVEMAQMNNSYDDDSEEPAAASARLYSNASNSGGGKLVRSTGLARMLRNGQQSGGGSQALANFPRQPPHHLGDSGLMPPLPGARGPRYCQPFRSYVRSTKKQQQQTQPGGGGGGGTGCSQGPASLLTCFGIHETLTRPCSASPVLHLLDHPGSSRVLVFFGTLFTFGFAPIGVTVYNTRLAEIITRNMLSAKVCAIDYHNLFIGPRMSDLIRNILEQQRRAENLTGCCIHNDGSAAIRAPPPAARPFMSTWVKWTADKPGPENRISGPVCGQDPRTCQEPRSNGYQTWPDDTSPGGRTVSCRGLPSLPPMNPTTLTARSAPGPAAFGIKGEYALATPAACWASPIGTTRASSTACSPACSCTPGLITLAITLLPPSAVPARLEQLAGWHRTALIYIGSGVMGNLVSINFLPYLVGSLAPILIEFGISVAIFLLAFAVLIGLGLFPWFDNFANLGGLASGCLLSVVLLPYIHRGSTEQSAYRCRPDQRLRLLAYLARRLSTVWRHFLLGASELLQLVRVFQLRAE
uniref:Rhomboid domain-containing protein n=1 Tax=Macrostomum lignano TaxID=282301 RepID=A0A1I8FBJ2_9PLAT